ncbi:hypothetical protein [Paracoccus sp. 22332]|uniref:hypothetical protein n=1 Tax=Paracoccus sp. 22332 TaxID=3453913 RepID=UPI003F83D567
MLITLSRVNGNSSTPVTIAINHIVAFEPYLDGARSIVYLTGLKGPEGHKLVVLEKVDAIQQMMFKAQVP